MKVKCIYNTGDFLRDYENRPIEKEQLGRSIVTGKQIGRAHV